MPTAEVEEFARILVRQVRDVAVRNCDTLLRPNARSPIAARWKRANDQGASLLTVIPDAVDETVFGLLSAIDQGALRVKFMSSDGHEIDLGKEGLGELAGWYTGSGGWRATYSEERHFDDFAELA